MASQVTTDTGVTYTDFHEDTPESMKNEKRAILAAMAEHGTEGQAEYEKAQQAATAARKSSIEMAAARGAQVSAPGTLAAELTQDYDALVGPLTDNTTSAMIGHGREMDRIAAANAAYLDQVAAASQLNRDLLAEGLAGSGGGGGGGGGGGSYGSSGYTTAEAAAFDPSATLEAAGQAAGLAAPVGDQPSGTTLLFGDPNDPDAPGGDERAKAVLEQMQLMAADGMSPEEMQVALVGLLEESGLAQWQKDSVATTIHNYLSLGEPVELGAYYEDALPQSNIYTTAGDEYQDGLLGSNGVTGDSADAEAYRAQLIEDNKKAEANAWLEQNPGVVEQILADPSLALPRTQQVPSGIGPDGRMTYATAEIPGLVPASVLAAIPEIAQGRGFTTTAIDSRLEEERRAAWAARAEAMAAAQGAPRRERVSNSDAATQAASTAAKAAAAAIAAKKKTSTSKGRTKTSNVGSAQ